MVLAAADPAAVRTLAALLAGGGVAIIPCDTIYGIVGIDPEADARIRALKGRDEGKPFLRLAADASWALRLTGRAAPDHLARHWPGPLTLVLPVKGGATLALRIPAAAWLRELIAGLGQPLLSTSANRTGRPSLWRAADIIAEFESEVDLVLDGGDLPDAEPSTIVDASSQPFRILRQGAFRVPAEDLR
ncbi:MAG: L-threonylcarbamoyladenylate synthase [Spirochaetes bacterium]|nr:L-threonylcarbamoyladenylate synthase [Spirochaetota bacterium]